MRDFKMTKKLDGLMVRFGLGQLFLQSYSDNSSISASLKALFINFSADDIALSLLVIFQQNFKLLNQVDKVCTCQLKWVSPR